MSSRCVVVRNPNQLDMFPPTSDWETPTELPDLRRHDYVILDSETKDDGLSRRRGPGWAYKGWGHISGLAITVPGYSRYFPVRHPDSDNFPVENVLQWVRDHEQAGCEFVFHNSAYDVGWLKAEGVTLKTSPHDTMISEVLIDEHAPSYSLDNTCRRYGLPGKDEKGLRDAAAALGLDPKSEMWRMPARFVGPYAEQDGRSTLGLFELHRPILQAEGLQDAYDLERELILLWTEMRYRGIRVDYRRLEAAQEELRAKCDTLLRELSERIGYRRLITIEDLRSPSMLEQLHDEQGVPYPRTRKTGRGSFSTSWMEGHAHWLPNSIDLIKKLENAGNKFLGQYIQENTHLGRIHSEVHPLRDDEGGTISYRVSYSNPPLQQMPARVPDIAKTIRGVFLPEDGELWGSLDYSQQEPRLTVHYAYVLGVAGAETAMQFYRDDPNADYHTIVATMFEQPRKTAKILNLGMTYGMGVASLAGHLGTDIDEAKVLLNLYHERVPYVRKLDNACKNRAESRGFIRLLDGRKCRFPFYEPSDSRGEEYERPLELSVARERYKGRRLKRAWTRTALNRLIQGGSAVQTKKAMRLCWREGIMPNIQMHDELGFSFSAPEQAVIAERCMREAHPLEVPAKVDVALGPDWGFASDEKGCWNLETAKWG